MATLAPSVQNPSRTIAVSFHASGLPPHILRLFEPPAVLEVGKVGRRKKKDDVYSGLAGYVKFFEGGEEGTAGGRGVKPAPPADEQADGAPPLPEEEGSQAMEVLSEAELRKKKVGELKDLLNERGLPASGKKDELVERLVAYFGQKKEEAKEEDGMDAPPPLPMDENVKDDVKEADEGALPPPMPADEGEILPDAGDAKPPPPLPIESPSTQRIFLNKELNYQMRIDGPTKLESMIQALRDKNSRNEVVNEEALKLWDPTKDPNVEGDPMCTLFVGGLHPDVSQRKLQREFESFGAIKRVRVVHDRTSGKSKGYGFVEFEEKDDMKEAYKQASGLRIEGKRCFVDVERGRTVMGWKPKRLGGGAVAMRGKKATFKLPRNWPRSCLQKVVFRELGMEVRSGYDDRPGAGGGGYGGYDRKRGYDQRSDRSGGHGYGHGHGRDRGGGYRDRDGAYRRDDRGGGSRGGDRYGGGSRYDDRRGDGHGGDRYEGRRREDRGGRYDDRGGRHDDRRDHDRPRDDRGSYEYRDPKRERISYDDFAAPADTRHADFAAPAPVPARNVDAMRPPNTRLESIETVGAGGDQEEGEI